MPFTKEQLKNVGFYKEFVDELQTKYLERVKELKQDNFRRNGVLYSFEEIISTNGLESIPKIEGVYEGVIDRNDLSKMNTTSDVTSEELAKTSILEQTINRNISELSTSRFAETLPDNIVNGDDVTSDDFNDLRIYRVENNQKRLYADEGLFFANSGILNLKTITETQLENIPSGEDFE